MAKDHTGEHDLVHHSCLRMLFESIGGKVFISVVKIRYLAPLEMPRLLRVLSFHQMNG